MLSHLSNNAERFAPVQLHCKTHLYSIDLVTEAGTCIQVQLVQGFNHHCFCFDFTSNTANVSDSENCDIFTSFILSVPFNEL